MESKSQQPTGRKPENPAQVVDHITSSFRTTAEEVTPWFLNQMPLMYFQDTNDADQLTHLQAIIAAKASDRPIELTLRSEDASQWTVLRPHDHPGVLAEVMQELPWDQPLCAAKIHTAGDGNLVIDTFEFGAATPYSHFSSNHAKELKAMSRYATEHMSDVSEEQVRQYFSRCSEEYILSVTPHRMAKHWALVEQLSGSDDSVVVLERETDPSMSRIIVAVSNSTRRSMLQRIAKRLSKSKLNIRRAHLDSIGDGENGWITIIGCVVQNPEGSPVDEQSNLWKEIRQDLLRLKWYDPRSLDLGYEYAEIGLRKAEIIIALVDLCYQVLLKKNAYAFNPARLHTLMLENIGLVSTIADIMIQRFDPKQTLSDKEYDNSRTSLAETIENSVDLEDGRTLLHTMLKAIHAIRRTNLFLEARYALAMRIDAALLSTDDRAEIPYGVFYIHGRNFSGFHVRFRDIARGGIRAITPTAAAQFGRERARIYDEAYNLAAAQQLKNKDIPEGGAKAAILVHPSGRADRSVRAFVDAMLDLITPEETTRAQVVDHLHHDELIYLGPDENISPNLIEWIVDRGQQRGYPMPTALMSSKPGAGINHKAYGVTSEGVIVFLDTALRSIGINPDNDEFSIKLTGGPDGDVAGNALRILHRDYGTRVKILGIADGSGCGEDPEGLDHQELLRLFSETLPIAHFQKNKLGPLGRVTSIEEAEGIHLRNTLHNRIESDAFIPCGGRPASIHGSNWKNFLKVDGTPSSRIIVEGANLFLTPNARRELSHAGTLILKDSSANKCGVICSSYEISACMLLSETQFMAIKEQFVEQVLQRLRGFARAEAELLARLHQHHPHSPLPDISIRISRIMARTADAINQHWDSLTPQQQLELQKLVVEHLPEVLVEHAGDALWNKLPKTYIRWMMVKSLAARMVYREGFEYLETMETVDLAQLALRYLDLEQERALLINAILGSEVSEKHRIAKLLNEAGIFSTMGQHGTESS